MLPAGAAAGPVECMRRAGGTPWRAPGPEIIPWTLAPGGRPAKGPRPANCSLGPLFARTQPAFPQSLAAVAHGARRRRIRRSPQAHTALAAGAHGDPAPDHVAPCPAASRAPHAGDLARQYMFLICSRNRIRDCLRRNNRKTTCTPVPGAALLELLQPLGRNRLPRNPSPESRNRRRPAHVVEGRGVLPAPDPCHARTFRAVCVPGPPGRLSFPARPGRFT